MADTKITALAAITTVDPAADVLPIVDISDTSMAASGTTKKITSNQILGAGGTATLASATITGDLTVDTSTFYVSSSADKVGVGTTSLSGEKLTVAGNVSANAWIGRANISAPTADVAIYRAADNTFAISTANTERLRVDVSGNLGLGVTPSAWAAGFRVIQASTGVAISTNGVVDRCDISANYYFNSGNKFLNATGRASNFSQDGGAFYFYQSTAASGGVGSAITWGPGMTLDASGNLLVGTTSGTFFRIISSFLSSSGNGGIKLIDSQSNNTAAFANFSNGTGTLGSITNNGNGGVLYNTLSDYRLKEDVQPLVGGLARVNALKPSIYKWKTNGSNGEGFLAHELAEIVPAAVCGEKDAVNEDGSIKSQGVDMSRVVPILVAAIQELAAEVNALKKA